MGNEQALRGSLMSETLETVSIVGAHLRLVK